MIFEISSGILENFETKDTARESSLKLSRKMIRLSGRAIKSIHRGECDIAKQLLDEVSTLNREIISELEDHPDIFHAGFVEMMNNTVQLAGRPLMKAFVVVLPANKFTCF